jgi:Ser/Thr protein kinase RdoA (MazF antagonist)
VLLAATVLVGEPTWIRAAGAVLALGALAFAAALARVLGHLHAGAQQWPPHSPNLQSPRERLPQTRTLVDVGSRDA